MQFLSELVGVWVIVQASAGFALIVFVIVSNR